MKIQKALFVSLLFLLASSSVYSQDNFKKHIGIKAGISQSRCRIEEFDYPYHFDSKYQKDYTFGIIYRTSDIIPGMKIAVEALYTRKHNIIYTIIYSCLRPNIRTQYFYYYVSIPIMLQYSIKPFTSFLFLNHASSIYVESGIEPLFLVNKKTDEEGMTGIAQYQPDPSVFTYGFIAGGGLHFNTPLVEFALGFRYFRGLSNVFRKDGEPCYFDTIQVTLTAFIR